MTRVQLTRRAQADLRGIREFIAQDNPRAAAGYVEGLRAAFLTLADMPLSGRARDELQRPGLRSFAHREHVIFYRPADAGVIIFRVIHGKQDLGRIFQ